MCCFRRAESGTSLAHKHNEPCNIGCCIPNSTKKTNSMRSRHALLRVGPKTYHAGGKGKCRDLPRKEASGTRYSMKRSKQTTKSVVRPRVVSYRFSAFVRAIDELPVSQIKMTIEDYQKCIAWDVAEGNVRPNQNIQKFLRFGKFL